MRKQKERTDTNKQVSGKRIDKNHTGRKGAEERLASEHALLEAIINSPENVIVFSLDTQYRYTAFNAKHRREMKKIWNVDIQIGMNLLDCMNIPELRALAKQSADRALRGESFSEEQHQTDSNIYYEFNWNPVILGQTIAGAAVFVRDITEQKRAAEEIRNLARFPAENPNPVLRIARNGRLLYVNEASLRMLPEWYLQCGQTAPRLLQDLVTQTLNDGAERTVDLKHRDRDFAFSVAPILEDGYSNLYGRDVTERKRAEETIRAISARQQALLDATPDIIMELDANKVYTWANPAGIEFFGEDVLGKEASYYFEGAQDTYDVVDPLFGRRENVIYVESWQRRKDGEKRWLAWWCRALKDERGNVIGALSSARDITERKKAEKSLRESEEKYRTLFENAQIGIYCTTPDGRILAANPALIQMLGYLSFDELARRNLNEKGFEPGYERRHFKERIEREGEVKGFVSSWTKRDDSGIIVLENARAVRSGEGDILYYEGLVEDITERKRAEEEIRKLNAELEQRVKDRTAELVAANEELEAFSYSVSHDLRAPLRAVDGFSRILLDEYASQLPPDAQRYAELVRSNTLQMSNLVDNLLAFSRSGRQMMIKDRVKPTELVDEALDLLRGDQEGLNIKINIGELPTCQADRALLKQVFVNLLSNALKFTRKRDPAVIEVGCIRRDREDVFFVRDNGIGFDMRYVGKLFAVFQRLHRSEDYEGTGVGLAIVQRIVHRHGGRVWAEAELDKGATFYFTLKGDSP